ncbi:methylated-DNA--[protein]-cysteine S-methyltransferase [Frigidibacter sp. RF13]|nr:methylated-DNA--[protein]-cysteine S-methyltransferase [Frigidibacter sp. RF13]
MLSLSEEHGRIARLRWGQTAEGESSAILREAAAQLQDYFAGRRQVFNLPLAFLPGLAGEVQRAMLAIPFGETRTYGDLSKALGAPAQAIGQACGSNPIPILIPCHRILGANGLGGFSAPGGIETKVALLKHEGAASLLI